MAKTTKEALMNMVEAFINNKTEESEIALHEAFVLKTQQILEAKECKDEDKEDKDEDKEDKKDDKDEDKDEDSEDDEDSDEDSDEDDKEEMEESFKAKKPAKKMLPKHKSGFKGMKKVKAKV